MTDPDPLSSAFQLLSAGQLDEARIYLEELFRQDPGETAAAHRAASRGASEAPPHEL